jgi:ABC-type antimicrobial peptide transport system permease subunit
MTQQAQFEASYAEPKMLARLGGFLGLLAGVLVATGLYGTSAYLANRRTTEIGMRMALGAERRQVLWMVLRESLLTCSVGIVAGLAAAVVSVRLLSSMLYQLSPLDPASFALATGSVVLIGGAAAWLPAWKAAKVDPMVALRHD